MKIYEILDAANKLSIGVLLYYEKKKEFVIELQSKVDEWTEYVIERRERNVADLVACDGWKILCFFENVIHMYDEYRVSGYV